MTFTNPSACLKHALAAIAALFFVGCGTDGGTSGFEQEAAEQDEAIARYLEERNIDAIRTESGMYYEILPVSSGPPPGDSSVVEISYKLSLINGTAFDSAESFVFRADVPAAIAGFNEAVDLMRVGDRITLYLPFYLGFGVVQGGQTINDVDLGSSPILIAEVALLDVRTEDEQLALEEAALEDYLETNGYAETALSFPSGLRVVPISDGLGARPDANDRVTLDYVGTLVNGEEFDSGEEFQFSVDAGQVVAGFNEGVKQVRPDGRALLVVPSELGYGVFGVQLDIPPYSTLVFDVTLQEVNPASP